jgi:hypothetical protein
VYARTVDGKVLTFGVSGKLVRNSLLMYDRETHSLWSHLTGGAIEGPLKGAQLQVLTATETTWSSWLRAYPSTKVLPHDYPGQTDAYRRYYANGNAGILGRKREDQRLPAKALVVGVRITDRPKAYALTAVVKARVVNDAVGEVPLVLFRTGNEAASVFRRDVAGQTLTFQASAGGSFTDAQTNSTWDPVTGRAIDGALKGTSLSAVPGTTSFWFGWFDFFPGTELYPATG